MTRHTDHYRLQFDSYPKTLFGEKRIWIGPRDWTKGWTLDWTSSHQDGMRSYIKHDIFLPLVTCKYISDLFEKAFWSLA